MVEVLAEQLATIERTLTPIVHALVESLTSAGATGHADASAQAATIERAVRDASAQAQQIANVQAQMAGANAAQVATLREMQQAASQAKQAAVEAQQAARAQATDMQQASQFARQLIAAQQAAGAQLAQAAQAQTQTLHQQQQVLAQEQQVLAAEQQVLAQEQQVLAQESQVLQREERRSAELGQIQAGLQKTAQAAQAAGLVQRPGASAAENEAVARAQLAQAKALASGASPELGAAVYRVEQRLGELIAIVKNLKSGAVQGGASAAAGNHQRYEASIDLESASNFYTWKKGGDVVREGGVFIASYRGSPNLGTTIAVHVSLPGGVEFEAVGVVEWARPPGEKGPPWPQPGFGARLEGVSPDTSRLVQQFVKAREPILFESA